MSFIQASFFSPVLLKQVAMNVILPETGAGPFPVYYLLHGLSDDHTIWQRRTAIEWYVRNLPLIVAMPDGYRGFYTDCEDGPAYGKYMLQDVVGFVERTFPALKGRAGRSIGGLSMGGYGALRLALAHPEMFVSANSHSGVCEAGHGTLSRDREPEFERIFGSTPRGSAHDLFALAARLKRTAGGDARPALRRRIPRLQIDCGTDDSFLDSNRRFSAHLKKLRIRHEYAEHPGGHSWEYWDLHVRDALAFHSRALGI